MDVSCLRPLHCLLQVSIGNYLPLATLHPISVSMAARSEAVAADHESDEWCGAVVGEAVETFTNGLGTDLESSRFKTVVETAKKKRDFRNSGRWSLGWELFVLPFVWQMHKVAAHYVGDLFRVNTVVKDNLGYDSMCAYIETRGWCISKRKATDGFCLECRKLEEAIAAAPSNEGTLGLVRHLKGMIEELYETLNMSVLTDPFSGQRTTRFIDMKSFMAKVDKCAQDMQVAFMIVKHVVRSPCR